jgi:hypothetical protein
MKTSDIKYTNLSTDYNRLYDLLKNKDCIIAGFTSIDNNKKNDNDEYCDEYSKITMMFYNKKHQLFYLVFSIFESDLHSDFSFYDLCKLENVRFFDLDKS